MDREEANAKLYEKMADEQNTFREWLLKQPPEVVLDHAYEYSIREDIVMAMEEMELSLEQAEALLGLPSPLGEVYRAWYKTETPHMDDIRNVIENKADDVIETAKATLRDTPIYLQSGVYAREHDELDVFRASYKANVACKDEIETAFKNNYDDNRLNVKAIYKDVVEKFGAERVKLILATTINHKEWDGRFSHRNRAWAETIPMEACYGSKESDHSIYYVLNGSHSALVDLFVSYFCKEQIKAEELSDKESVLGKLQRPLPAPTVKNDKDVSHER